MNGQHVVIVGGGLRASAAALEFARYGVPVTVLHGWESPTVPLHPQIDPDGVISEWITDTAAPLREGEAPVATPVTTSPGPLHLRERGAHVAVPDDAVFGIPPSPLSTQLSRALGTGAALRAYADRLKPLLKVGKTTYVADLVRSRVGKAVLNRLVEPQVRFLFGAPSADVHVGVLAPGLNETMSRVGSLTGAALSYLDRYATLTSGVMPSGGWAAYAAALNDRLTHYGATHVHLEEKPVLTPPERTGDRWQVDAGGTQWFADAVVTEAPWAETITQRQHAETWHPVPEWWDDAAGTAGQTLFSLDSGWTARTTVREGRAFSELISPAEVVAPEVSLEAVVAMLAEVGVQDVATDAVVLTSGPGLDPTGDPEPKKVAPGLVCAGNTVGDRGFAGDLAHVLRAVPQLRRELLGLSPEA